MILVALAKAAKKVGSHHCAAADWDSRFSAALSCSMLVVHKLVLARLPP